MGRKGDTAGILSRLADDIERKWEGEPRQEGPFGIPFPVRERPGLIDHLRFAVLALDDGLCVVCGRDVRSQFSVRCEKYGLVFCSRHSGYIAERERMEDEEAWRERREKRALGWERKAEDEKAKRAAERREGKLLVSGEIVYYIDTRLVTPDGVAVYKIGTSRKARDRFRTHRLTWPYMRLLAVESGGHEIESVRHRQFEHLRVGLRQRPELFRAESELRAHVQAIRRDAIQRAKAMA